MSDTKVVKAKTQDGSEVEAHVFTGQPQTVVLPNGTKTVCYLYDGKLLCLPG